MSFLKLEISIGIFGM